MAMTSRVLLLPLDPQVEATRLNTASLTTDLDAMRHLFSEKEKELVVAVGKVEELTRQLEELRHGRSPLAPNNHHHNELDKLRRELLVSEKESMCVKEKVCVCIYIGDG